MKTSWKVLCFFIILYVFLRPAEASVFFKTKTSTLYQVFEPLFSTFGYRQLTIQVFDEFTEKPLPNALVMLGDQIQNGWYTNSEGIVSLDNITLPQGPLTLTIAHPNYSRFTLLQIEAQYIEVGLTPLVDTRGKSWISGSLEQWPEMEDDDGIVHAGLVLPFLEMTSLLNFSAAHILAPNVKAKIYKDIDLPANITLPSQQESMWGLVPVYISKPLYEFPFVKSETKNLIALAGTLPFSKMASGFLNKAPLTDLLNLYNLEQFNFVLNYPVPDQNTTLNIPLSYGLKPRFLVRTPTPPENKDIIYVSAGYFKNDPSLLFPLDFKVTARSAFNAATKLKSIYSQNQLPPLQEFILAMAADLPKQTDDTSPRDPAILGTVQRLHPTDTTIQISGFLKPIDLSYQKDSFYYRFRSLPTTTNPDAQLAVSFINIESQKNAKQKKPSQPFWTIISPSTVQSFSLPKLPNTFSQWPRLEADQNLTWTLNVCGFNQKDVSLDLKNINSEQMANTLTHFSRNEMVLSQRIYGCCH